MNESELRRALHDTLASSAQPPPMDSTTAVDAGRRAVRRRTTLAGAGVAGALLAITAVAVGPGQLLASPNDGTSWSVGGPAPSPTDAAGPSSQTVLADPTSAEGTPAGPAPAGPAPAPPTPGPSDTKPSWPTGPDGKPQADATSTTGPRFEQGKKLLAELVKAVPDGYTAPTGDAEPSDESRTGDDGKVSPDGAGDELPLRSHQAAIGPPEWTYLASAAVAKGGGTGRLMVTVHAKENTLPTEPCALARTFLGIGGECELVAVGDAQVGVVVKPTGDGRLDQWAAYRHPDGVVVFVAQSKKAANIDTVLAPLAALPLSVPELAALAVEDRFHLK